MQKVQKNEKPLPKDAEKYLDKVLDEILRLEEKGYHNPLVSFAQYAEKMRAIAHENVSHFYNQLDYAKRVLKEKLEHEEKHNPNIPYPSTFRSCEEALKACKENMKELDMVVTIDFNKSSLQQLAKIDWSFMDRSYQLGKKLMEENALQDAACLFLFLRYLNPMVFEYWLLEAICLHQSKDIENAMIRYGMSLLLQPKNPYVFFQMASIFYDLQEVEACKKLLDISIEYAKKSDQYAEIHKKAIDIKEKLKSQPSH
jgi:tetratricopeptide (TPR) repeat protein